MTGKSVVVTTILVLACFTAALLAYAYLDPKSVSSFVSSSAARTDETVNAEELSFEVEGKHNKGGKHHVGDGHKHKKPKPVRKAPTPVRSSPAPVRATSAVCYKTTATLNVRSSACGSVSTTLSSGTVVTAVGSSATKSGCSLGATLKWQQISAPVSGYVSDSYLVSTACASTPVTPTPPAASGDLTAVTLKACMPSASTSKVNAYLPYLNSAMREGSINTNRRKAAFLAQIGHESGSLVYMEEIASGAAYEGRRDLGNIYPGDGKKYKGRGPIQITGRSNYDAAGKALGLDLINNPEQAATPQVGFRLAVWFWNRAGLSAEADKGTQASFDTITRRINGGTNGKADRDSRWATCKRVLGA